MTRKIGKSPLLGAPYGQTTGAKIPYLPAPGVSEPLISAMTDAHREVAAIIGVDLSSSPDKTAVAIRAADGRYTALEPEILELLRTLDRMDPTQSGAYISKSKTRTKAGRLGLIELHRHVGASNPGWLYRLTDLGKACL